MVRSPCSEFPNANTELHAGAIFGCTEPCGPCVVTDRAPAAARHEARTAAEHPAAVAVPVSESPVSESPVSESPVSESPVSESPVSESPVAGSPVAERPVSERNVPGESGFFACADPAEPLDALWHEEHEEHEELPDVADIEPLVTEEQGFARVVQVLGRIGRELGGEQGPARVQAALSGQTPLPPPIAFALLHWRALLEGEDSAALPELTLDEWAAGFLAALFQAPASALRSRVRAEGIAAFGVLDAA